MGGKTFKPITKPVEKLADWRFGEPLRAVGNMVERWNPMPSFEMPKIPGPSPEQLAAQAAQARLLADQEKSQKATEEAAAASSRARRARMAGRNSLLLDDVGIIDGTRPLQTTMGG
jgi:hypothetical protein